MVCGLQFVNLDVLILLSENVSILSSTASKVEYFIVPEYSLDYIKGKKTLGSLMMPYDKK